MPSYIDADIMYEKTFPHKRYSRTLSFLKKHIHSQEQILDLGVPNPLSKRMEKEGFSILNTKGEDLDMDQSSLQANSYEVVTAFEIFEHLLSPFQVLQEIKGDKLVASVPLRLWFARAYQNKSDPRDRHYHEFEAWQFDWLLEKSGWEIKDRDMFTNPVKKFGIRPFLRRFVPRYYLVYAERKK